MVLEFQHIKLSLCLNFLHKQDAVQESNALILVNFQKNKETMGVLNPQSKPVLLSRFSFFL